MSRNITQHLENFKRDGLTIFESQLDVTVLDQWQSIFKKKIPTIHVVYHLEVLCSRDVLSINHDILKKHEIYIFGIK